VAIRDAAQPTRAIIATPRPLRASRSMTINSRMVPESIISGKKKLRLATFLRSIGKIRDAE
jgi:hypothetical protein